MKILFAVHAAVLMVGLNAMGGEPMKNVLNDIPYADGQMGRRQLVDELHLLVMQVALKPGQQVPQHNANSNVHLLIVEGQVVVTLEGVDTVAAKGDLVPVAYKTLGSYPQGGLRISPGYFNTEEEIDLCLEALRTLAREQAIS